jgi:hypothetical protein
MLHDGSSFVVLTTHAAGNPAHLATNLFGLVFGPRGADSSRSVPTARTCSGVDAGALEPNDRLRDDETGFPRVLA